MKLYQLKLIFSSLLIVLVAIGCSGIQYDRSYDQILEKVAYTQSFEVIGYVRVEGYKDSYEVSFDRLLQKAREKYNDDLVDVFIIKEDVSRGSGKERITTNALVIKYKPLQK